MVGIVNQYETLREFPMNEVGTCDSLDLDSALRCRLTSMGFAPGIDVEKMLATNGNILVRVGDTRIGVSNDIADKINVRYEVHNG